MKEGRSSDEGSFERQKDLETKKEEIYSLQVLHKKEGEVRREGRSYEGRNEKVTHKKKGG